MRTIKKSDFDSLSLPYIASKQTQVVIWNILMTKIDKKLDKVHINLWGSYYPASIDGKTYGIILLDT